MILRTAKKGRYNMNKYNFDRAGFEVSHGGRRACTSCASSEIKGSYGETLNRSVSRQSNDTSGGCGSAINSRFGLKDYPVGSVYAPLQDFDGLYDTVRALKRGTLFRALDLPLNVGLKVETNAERNDALWNLQQLDFAINETKLYLDVYPNCTAAKDYIKMMREKRAILAEEYESKHGMLTMYGVCGKSSDIQSPAPWEYCAN